MDEPGAISRKEGELKMYFEVGHGEILYMRRVEERGEHDPNMRNSDLATCFEFDH